MKVLPQLTTSQAKKLVSAATKKMPQHPQQKINGIQIAVAKNVSSQARETLERNAEEMTPETYLQMRNYLSRLEMEELIRTKSIKL